MVQGDEPPRVHERGASKAGGRSQRPSGDVCAKPLRLEHYLDARGVPSSGAGPSQNRACLGICIGSTILAGRRTVNIFPFGRTRVCIRQSVCEELMVSLGQNCTKQSYPRARY